MREGKNTKEQYQRHYKEQLHQYKQQQQHQQQRNVVQQL